MRLDHARICIVMLSALGDAVHVLPLINAIKRHAPRSRITWFLEPAGARLMSGHPSVDEIIVHGRGIAALRELRRKMRGREFDVLIDLQVALKAGLATALIPADVKLGFDRARARDLNWLFTNRRIPARGQQHVQDQYLEFLEWLGVPAYPLEWKLGPWPGEEQLAAKWLARHAGPFVGLGIASSREEKDWVASRWAELATRLHADHGLTPMVLGGSSEKERAIAATIETESGAPVINTLGSSLRELVALISRCALTVSVDSAPMHMSVALDVPVVGLMGYTNPRRVGPYRRFTDLLVDAYGGGEDYAPSLEYRAGRMERIAVAEVLSRVQHWRERYAAARAVDGQGT